MGETVGRRNGNGALPLLGETPEGETARLRESIDRVDQVLVRLLNQRVRYAVEIGRMKRLTQQQIHSPEREIEVLANVVAAGEGPLDATALRHVFEAIIAESRRIESELASKED